MSGYYQTSYGKALERERASRLGMQHYSDSYTITLDELKTLIKENNIKPEKLFSKEQILNDPKVKEYVDNLILNEEMEREVEADRLKENDLIPGDDKPTLTPEQKKQQEKDNEFVPDEKGEPGNSDDMIPD